MFESLFSRPNAIQRHRSGPLAAERRAFLERLAALGTPRTDVLVKRCRVDCGTAWPLRRAA